MDSLEALADPTRRRILELLSEGERSAGAISEGFAMSPPAISQHLKVLREAGLVRVRVDAQRRIYSLDAEGLAAVEEWLRRIRLFWSNRLDVLEQRLREDRAANESHQQ